MHLPSRRAVLGYFPRGYALPEDDWMRRHKIVLGVLVAHVPALVLFGLFLDRGIEAALLAGLAPALCAVMGWVLRGSRRVASGAATLGLVSCSVALVVLSHGMIEAHFHFFIIIGFIALYQDWIPFLLNIVFTVLSHGFGSAMHTSMHGPLVFNHAAGQASPWLWSLIHGAAVLFACSATMVFWRITEEQQQERQAMAEELGAMGRRRFTADLLVNLARRNQSMLYRQADIINQLEESERDPDKLGELFTLDHLTTRVRRNSESLLVLSGEAPSRMWSNPVPLRDVVRAAIAETEDLERVDFDADERAAVLGHTVTDVTHLLAELTENAVRFSPPASNVAVRTRPDRSDPGGHVLTVEDCGVGMPDDDRHATNELLADPPEVDLSVANRLGFHVVARLAGRHGIRVSLHQTPGSGITAVVSMPSAMFAPVGGQEVPVGDDSHRVNSNGANSNGQRDQPPEVRAGTGKPDFGFPGPDWTGWWESEDDARAADPSQPRPGPAPTPQPEGDAVPSPRPSPSPAPAPAPRPIQQGPLHKPGPAREQSPGREHSPIREHSPAPEQIPAQGQSPAPPIPAQRAESPPEMPATLRRRVPQASIAPALREPGPAPEPPARMSADRAAEAANALSRFQAHRDAARTETGHDPAVGFPDDGARS